jgi:hypothetical protein
MVIAVDLTETDLANAPLRRREIHVWMLENLSAPAQVCPLDNARLYDGAGQFSEGRVVRYEFASRSDALRFKLTFGGA